MANIGVQFLLSIFLFALKYECKFISDDAKNTSSLQYIEDVEDEGGGIKETNNGLLYGKTVTEIKLHPNGSAVSLGNKEWDNIVSTLLNQKIETNFTKNENTTIKLNKPEKEDKSLSDTERYTCIKCNAYDCDNPDFCHNAAQCYQARQRDSTGTETYSRGCIEKVEQIGFVCSSSFHMQVEALAIKCCDSDLCNNENYPLLPYPSDSSNDKNFELVKLALYAILGTSIILSVIITIGYYVMTRYFFKQRTLFIKGFSHRSSFNPFSSVYKNDCKFLSAENSALRGMLNESVSSGSGSGLPLFVQRTLARNIYLEDVVGKGRYSEVWKGSWHGEPVAVKIFSSREEASWSRETEIYSVLLRHENILCFYGSDKTSRASCTQLWLVSHYHPNGSMHDYLKTHILDHKDLFNICLTMINGLLHLHTEIMGTQGKPAIAHRDLNSNNILIKYDGTCCISDFGLAVVRSPGTEEIDLGNNDRSGTIRYMSPENLNGTMDMELFESFRKADIYAIALVMWEACRRCLCNGIAEEYSRPYDNVFPSEPTYEEMQRYVCIQGARPPIPNRWTDDKVLSNMERILNECWHQDPNVRLTALRIKKNLLKISIEDIKDDGSNKLL